MNVEKAAAYLEEHGRLGAGRRFRRMLARRRQQAPFLVQMAQRVMTWDQGRKARRHVAGRAGTYEELGRLFAEPPQRTPIARP